MILENEITITALAHGGDGIGRIDGQVCFVPYGLPGDVVRVEVVRRARQVLWGRIAEVIEASPDRIDPACPNFGRCGVCTWAHFGYPAQAEWKQRLVREALQRMGGIEVAVRWVDEPALRTGYRTRAELHGDGKHFGFFARGTHDIVDTLKCPLCHARLNEAIGRLRPLKPAGPVTVTVNPEGEEVLVWTKSPSPKILEQFPLAGSPAKPRPPSQFLFDGVPVVNGGFSQASLLLNRLLVREVRECVGAAGAVLDLYCGSGNFSLGLLESCVVGVDHHAPSVRAAQEARGAADPVSGANYRRGDEGIMGDLIAGRAWDTIILDPPRTGAKALAPALAAARAARIVYVSCDAPTLARDLKVITAGGWKPARTTVVDMFPYTAHMETVCCLERSP
ncbi:MAG: class I SAM-dependent RNA methyltransferase [Candidatus Hydrogenedentes bacterium]|nr:class I SAM-dependent RNA methyltransferase [Candidatus Hydrogenedentota bacterium]